MCKKIFISFLVFALLNLLASCYSVKQITVPEYNQISEGDKPDEILIITKDFHKYQFSKYNLYILNDTLYGQGKIILTDMEQAYDGEILSDKKIAINDIDYIEIESYDKLKTCLVGGGISLGIIGLIGIITLLVAADKGFH